jgi:NarL family two-component system response regulator LiaR
MGKIRVLLADDHTVLRQGIAQVLESQADMTVVAQAKDGPEAVELAKIHQPDVALLDINMPEMDGVEATRRITAELPTGVIILTMYRRDDYIFEAIKAGASGYLLKEAELSELLRAIRTVAQGEAVIDAAIAGRVMAELRSVTSPAVKSTPEVPLAERDIEILRLLAQGQSNQDIADQLSISEKTVRNRLSLVFHRFHLKNRTEAVLYAMRQGLVEPPDIETEDDN